VKTDGVTPPVTKPGSVMRATHALSSDCESRLKKRNASGREPATRRLQQGRKRRLENRGTSAARYYGLSLSAQMGGSRRSSKSSIAVFFVELIAPWQRLLLVINES